MVNVDGERALVAVRATGGAADASLGGAHMAASVAVGSFEIEDLLVGPRCPAHAYLARSFDTPAGALRQIKSLLLRVCRNKEPSF